MPPQASVLLLTYNGAEELREVLEKVKQQEGVRFETLAIDSSSTDSTQEILQEYAVPFEVIPQQAFNHGLTRNQIAQKAKGEFLVYLTQDAIPVHKEWLKNLLQPFADSQVAGVYSRQINKHYLKGSLWDQFFFEVVYPGLPRKITQQNWHGLSRTNILFSNASSAIRKSVWQEIPFPRTLMSEDQKWAYEAIQAGFTIYYEPSSRVYHAHSQSLKSHIQRNFDSGYSLQGFKFLPLPELIAQLSRYYWREVRFAAQNGKKRHVPAIMAREVLVLTSFIMGLHNRHLPEVLIKKLSALYQNR